jgi:hypothetical protein
MTAAARFGKRDIKIARIEPHAAASEIPPNNLEKIIFCQKKYFECLSYCTKKTFS